jgi:hypothetical protein
MDARRQPEWKKEQQAPRRRFEDAVRSGIADHHGYVSRWCQERHSVSLATVPVDAPTIELLIQATPRRLGIADQEFDELDFWSLPPISPCSVISGLARRPPLGDWPAMSPWTLKPGQRTIGRS